MRMKHKRNQSRLKSRRRQRMANMKPEKVPQKKMLFAIGAEGTGQSDMQAEDQV